MEFVLIQIVGFIGAGLLIFSFQSRRNRGFIYIQTAGYFMYMLQFILLDALTGAGNLFICLLRNLMLSNQKRRWAQHKAWLWIFVGAYLLVAILTWQGLISILPCVAMVTSTLAMWTRNGKTIRIANFFICSPAWILYDLYFQSYSGVFCEAFSMISIVISVARYGIKALDTTD
jgi:hypothetical protein